MAETAHHDPILVDDPSYEVEDYFSDWDDLSDEYYDDEPTVVRRLRMAALKNGASAAKPTSPPNPNNPNADADVEAESNATNTHKPRSVPSKPRLSVDPASFQSVVWKPSDYGREPVQLHPPGEGEKVALLKNWREVFRNSNPAIGRPARFKKLASSSVSSRSRNQLATAGSGVADDLKQREDSSDQTSRVSSLENLRDNDTIGSGDASNTTPTKSLSPALMKVGGARQDEEMADVDADEEDKLSSNVVVEIPVPKAPSSSPPKKKGRKRKADVIADDETENTENANGMENNKKRPRSQRIASNTNTTTASHDDKAQESARTPLRRSTRQKG